MADVIAGSQEGLWRRLCFHCKAFVLCTASAAPAAGSACRACGQPPAVPQAAVCEMASGIRRGTARSLLIKRSDRTLRLADYDDDCILHVGLSDSRAASVYSFWFHIKEEAVWEDALCVPLPECELDDAGWDAALLAHAAAEKERIAIVTGYHALDNNCYDFVLRFLNSISYNACDSHDKMSFVERVVEPPVVAFEERCARYAALAACGGCSLLPVPPAACDGCGVALVGRRRWKCATADVDACDECKADVAASCGEELYEL
eukprot:PLAT8234.1.p1 GENE.PLAT8234.1~~PLAT8234.1.p1  ORF type:complete len:262 (+),score=108.97 PLAT8234.1:128-913(+)